MIVGVGIDLVEVGRIGKIVDRHGRRFLGRVYSDEELRYCMGQARPALHLAARFAAKEAFLKATGWGIGGGIRLCEIETTRDEHGKPALRITGESGARFGSCGLGSPHLSISHTRDHATAVVILERSAPRGER